MATTALGALVGPSDADKYVKEGTVEDLTWDLIAWIGSVQPEQKLIRLRYEWEKLIEKSSGTSMFLELTYESLQEFPCAEFYFQPLVNWHVCFVDFVEYGHRTKVIIRLIHKEDME